MKYRQRYVDLIVTRKTRQDFIVRSRIVSGIRRFLEDQGFLEVETPMMHPIAVEQRPAPSSLITTRST
jgi:lysyl-tRNA synthetase class 2